VTASKQPPVDMQTAMVLGEFTKILNSQQSMTLIASKKHKTVTSGQRQQRRDAGGFSPAAVMQ